MAKGEVVQADKSVFGMPVSNPQVLRAATCPDRRPSIQQRATTHLNGTERALTAVRGDTEMDLSLVVMETLAGASATQLCGNSRDNS